MGINWYEANAYCKWLCAHWKELPESSINSSFIPKQIRLPLDIEWTLAAGGDLPNERYPWDKPGKTTTDVNEIIKRTNIAESNISRTTPVNQYPEGKSPFGVMDMSGNVWEWQTNYFNSSHGSLGLRGGSWFNSLDNLVGIVRSAFSNHFHPSDRHFFIGFRVAVFIIPNG